MIVHSTVRRMFGCLLVPVAACWSSNAPAQAVAPAPTRAAAPVSIVGEYRQSVDVPMVCDEEDWCHEESEDTLSVTAAPDDGIAIDIAVVRTNGHTCQFEGTLKRDPRASRGTRRWVYRSDGDDEGEDACELVLEQSGDKVTTRADGCRYWCGVRASLDATFPFPPSKRVGRVKRRAEE